MRELILSGDSRIEFRAGTRVTPEGADVLVKVEVVGICASDVALFKGTYSAPHKQQVCFGHEWSGVVEAIGSQVRELRPGDRVTGECSLWCGECDRCATNKNLCRHIRKAGITVDGAARELVTFAERHLHRASADLPAEVLALAEPLSVCREAIIASGVVPLLPHKRVLVVGAGMLGLGCAMLLSRMFGCRQVLVHDIEPKRLDRAEQLGMLPLAKLPEAAQSSDYAKLYGDERFDVIIETTGSMKAFEQTSQLISPGGAMVLLGFSADVTFAPRTLVINAARVVGSIGGSGSFSEVVSWLERHARDARQFITHTFPAAHAAQGFAAAQNARKALKVQLRFAA